MGEAPVREDCTVTRSAEVKLTFLQLFIQLCMLTSSIIFCLMSPLVFPKYVGSFPVDDRCLDEQIEHLHRQLKELRVSPECEQVLVTYQETY